MEHRWRHLSAHDESDRNTDRECADYSLNHHKTGHANAVEEPDKAKQKASQQAVNGIGLEVVS